MTNAPTAYVLQRIFVGKGNERHVTLGAWTTSVGSKVDPAATVATLAGSPGEFAHFQQVGANLRLMLDGNLEPRVGDAVHSFTLSRTED